MPAPKEITPEEWQRIVSVYAKHDGRLKAIAAELGWPFARTQRRWNTGYPSLGLPPIKDIIGKEAFSAAEIRAARQLNEERLPSSADVTEPLDEGRAVVISTAEEARIKQMVKREEERERARQDALKARGEEATLVQINRRNAIALNLATMRLLQGASTLSEQIEKDLKSEAASGKMPVAERLRLVRSAASIARFNAEATMMAVKAERLVTGQPIETDTESAVSEGTLNEAAAWIEQCRVALERARERGLITAEATGSKNS